MTASKAAREFPRGLESGIDALVLSRIDVLRGFDFSLLLPLLFV